MSNLDFILPPFPMQPCTAGISKAGFIGTGKLVVGVGRRFGAFCGVGKEK